MKGAVIDMSGKECYLYKDSKAEFLLIQPVDEHDLEVLDQEVEMIKALSDRTRDKNNTRMEYWQSFC